MTCSLQGDKQVLRSAQDDAIPTCPESSVEKDVFAAIPEA